jgi:hypothetical protein
MALRAGDRQRLAPISRRVAPSWVTALVVGLGATGVAACDSTSGAPAHTPSSAVAAPSTAAPTTPIPTIATPTSAAATSAAPAATGSNAPGFTVTVNAVSTTELGASYHAGCPVGPESLRALNMTYWGFDNTPHTGVLVVNVAVVSQVESIFKQLYDARFPIRSMRPTADFGGSDPASMDADNTSGFNCRNAVAPGPPTWSMHAYGEAIDVNTIENPYIESGTVMPDAGRAYTDRQNVRPGMAVAGSTLNAAFDSVGWYWGGRWTDPDYQHFSATGG